MIEITIGGPFAAQLKIVDLDTGQELTDVAAGAVFFDCQAGPSKMLIHALLLREVDDPLMWASGGRINVEQVETRRVFLGDEIKGWFERQGMRLPKRHEHYLEKVADMDVRKDAE